jgi:hypothetical protein
MADIRSFFAPRGGSKGGPPGGKKPEEKKPEGKRRPAVLSDSDSDGEAAVPAKAPKPTAKPKKQDKVDPPKPKLKEVNAADFFATNAKEPKSSGVTPSKKRKEAEKGEKARDEAFAKTLEETDFSQQTKKQRTESPEKRSSLASKVAAQVISYL